MKINKEKAIKLWEERFGNLNETYDYAGRLIKKSEYGNQNSEYGWDIDHIRPSTKGGTDAKTNLIISNIKTNSNKADNFPVWKDENKIFQAKRIKKNHYKIEEQNGNK